MNIPVLAATVELYPTSFLRQQFPKKLILPKETLKAQAGANESELEANRLNVLGLAYMAQKNYPRAIEYFRQSLAFAENLQGSGGEGTKVLALNNLGTALFLTGQLNEAEPTLLKAMHTTELLRDQLGENELDNIQFFDTQQSFIYRTLQQVLVAQQKFAAALEIAERGRARILSERLTRPLSNPAVNTNAPVSKHSYITIQEIQNIAQARNLTIVEYSLIPDSSEIFISGRRGDELQNQPKKLFIWIVQPTGKIIFHSVDLQSKKTPKIPLSQVVASTRISLGARGRGSIEVASIEPAKATEQLQDVYNILIKPIEKFLPKNDNARVVLVPQESLFLIPFAALKDTSGKFLLERHTLITVPSIQILNLTYQQRQRLEAKPPDSKTDEPLIVGNPTVPIVRIGKHSEQLPDLPGAKEEAKAIARLFKVQALIGQQATKAAVLAKLPQARIIHFATHGLLDDFGEGIPGVIVFASSAHDNGLLTAKEIQSLQLNAELVILSACDTGRGRLSGDGVIGLSRSFMVAGVPSVIVSLWSIPDAPTALLMTEFYRNWLSLKLDKAQALRQAMLKIMKNYNSYPINWAGFILIGDAD